MAERPVFGEPLDHYRDQRSGTPRSSPNAVLFESDLWQQQQFLDRAGDILPAVLEHTTSPDALREAIAPYVDLAALRDFAVSGADLRRALRYEPHALPEEVRTLIDTLKLLVTPDPKVPIRSPKDLATYLMLDIGFLQQEQLKVVCVDTKNCVQGIHMVYQGTLDASMVRIVELFNWPRYYNSAAMFIAHNHPSGSVEPSPEDMAVTRHVVQAGKILECECLDSLIVGTSGYYSIRERTREASPWRE